MAIAKKIEDLTPPNHDFLELTFVGMTATGAGNNQQFTMENLGDGTFKATTSRVGIRVGLNKPKTFIVPMDEWDDVYAQKISRGFLLTKTKKMAKKIIKKSGQYRALDDKDVEDIINFLLMAANQTVSQNYSVSIEDISDEMIEFGRNILKELAESQDTLSVAAFNAKLHQLYSAIPRRIDNLSKMDVHRQKEFKDKLSNEQELLDFMVAQIRSNGAADMSNNPTILDAYGMDWRRVTAEEENYIKNMLAGNRSQYLRAWRVSNHKTEDAFEKYCKNKNLTEENGITRLFHGSRTENFWSITTNGLYLNPSGVAINGKAFGHGLYFAPKAQKSLGYTSRLNSYWVNGSSDKGYLAIYKVATGTIYDVYGEKLGTPDNYKQLQEKKPGADCLWAYAGKGYVVNDEVIVYREDQCTIEYFIEMAAA